MRWAPAAAACEECGFDWQCSRADAVAAVAEGPRAASLAMASVADPTIADGDTWSASAYVWHLVDVLRIGAERLLTIAIDPGAGIPCWDEKALAADRRYELLSPAVGLLMLEAAALQWADAAESAPPEARTLHPEFGSVGADDIIRRNAHEVHHHVMDITRRARR